MSTSRTPNVHRGTTTHGQKPPDGIILVMGMTGSGKSSFIQLVTGDPRINIGHGVRSETSEIGVYDWTAPDGRVFALVDSPGFDDSNGKTDTDVLDQIAGFLKETYGKINGLIYCQRIDVRAGGLTIRNLRMFQRVCGLALENAVIVTTHWDKVGDTRAAQLEQQLVTGEQYFKPLCDAGATAFGHNNTSESAERIMDSILTNIPMVLQMQEELEAGKTLEETSAGSELRADLNAAIKKHKAEIKKVREEMEEAMKAKDKVWQKELDDELARLREDVKRSTASKEQLKKPPSTSTMWQRFMRGGEEGARQYGMLGMFTGIGGAALVEGYRALKVSKALVTPGGSVEEAMLESDRDFDHIKAKSASMSDQGNLLTKPLMGPMGFWSGFVDVATGNVPKKSGESV